MQKSFYAALALMVSLTSAVSIKVLEGEEEGEEEGEAPTCRFVDTPWFSGWTNDIDGMLYEEESGCIEALTPPECRHVDTPWFSGWVNDVDEMMYDEESGCDDALTALGY